MTRPDLCVQHKKAPMVEKYQATNWLRNFYEPLIKYKDGEYVPCLATEWSSSDDGLTWTFRLREGVKFNDGSDLNAAAAKLYFDNMRPMLGMSANYGQHDMLVTEITADDDYTISFHLARPYYNVLNDLSMVMPRGILSAAAFNADGNGIRDKDGTELSFTITYRIMLMSQR